MDKRPDKELSLLRPVDTSNGKKYRATHFKTKLSDISCRPEDLVIDTSSETCSLKLPEVSILNSPAKNIVAPQQK